MRDEWQKRRASERAKCLYEQREQMLTIGLVVVLWLGSIVTRRDLAGFAPLEAV